MPTPSAVVVLVVLALAVPASAANLLRNGDFQQGTAGWALDHPWYAPQPGAGLAVAVAAPGEGRDGGAALKIVGGGHRGIAMQVLAAYPGRYRVTGWLKCDRLDAGRGGVLVEWLDHQSKWLRGDFAGEVRGTADWKHFDTVVEAPATARSVHLDLLTDAPNQGTIWFTGLSFERLATVGAPPPPPVITAEAAVDQPEAIRVTLPAAAGQVVRYLVFAADQPLDRVADRAPALVADSLAGTVTLPGLARGRTWHLRAVAVDSDGRASAPGPAVTAEASAPSAPRPGWLEADRLPDGRVRLRWWPHALDDGVAKLELVQGDRAVQTLTVSQPAAGRPCFQTTPWIVTELTWPADASQVAARAVSGGGQRSSLGLATIAPAGATGAGPWAQWSAGPYAQVQRSSPAPADATAAIEALAQPGESEGRQVLLRPTTALHRVRVVTEDLHAADGATLPAAWVAAHFVNYVKLNSNSRATPKPELVWPAPGEYPDELSDDTVRDLPAGQVQPIYLRLSVPRGARPGRYTGTVSIEAQEGRSSVPVQLDVAGPATPERPRLTFVYWFGWDVTCKQFKVDRHSADGWMVLRRLAELMRAHHQNSVVVGWDLIHVWQKPDGTLLCDWRDFDRYLATMQAAGVDQLFCLSHVGSRSTGDWACPTMVAGDLNARRTDTGEAVRLKTLDLLGAVQEHVAGLKLLDRFAVHVADEPIKENEASYRQLAAEVKARAPKLRRIDAIHVPDLRDSVEIMVPQLNYFEQWLPQFRQHQAQGTELWFYIAWVPQGAYPNRMIDSSALKPRVLHWLNALYDTTGYLHWALNWWDIPLTSLESPGDQYITWPSQRFVANSSLRYEAERDGLEDCELLFALRDKLERGGLSHQAAQAELSRLAAEAVQDIQHYSRDWTTIDRVRRGLIRKLEP